MIINNKDSTYEVPVVETMTLPREESCLGMIDSILRKKATIVLIKATHREWKIKYIRNKS